MRIGFVQFEPIFGEKERNIRRSIELMEGLEADLWVLPELCNTGYLFRSKEEVENLAEEIPDGPSVQAWRTAARERNVHIVAGMAERVDGKVFNVAVLVRPSGEVSVYRKTHLFDEEKRWFEPGDTGFEVIDIGPARIGMMVCFDWIFPEVARILALKGADLICHPANLVLPYCPDAMVTRCVENRVFAVTCNRIGTERRGGNTLRFIGSSQIVDPKGNVLVRSERDEESVQVVEIDLTLARDKQITERNDLFEDRRVALYGALIERLLND
ncbi:MAG: acyltransferase [Candidatus Latescibacteria bacterium]|nr:acyltransferase [Candidatus Latescibacterota bacterium]